jgi:hypothetical protein
MMPTTQNIEINDQKIDLLKGSNPNASRKCPEITTGNALNAPSKNVMSNTLSGSLSNLSFQYMYTIIAKQGARASIPR